MSMGTESSPSGVDVLVQADAGDRVDRPTFFEIGTVGEILFYLLAAVAIVVFLHGTYRRFARYARGREDPIDRLSNLPGRILVAARSVGSNESLFDRDPYGGVMHAFVLWGFLTLFVGTLILAVEIDIARPLGASFWHGDFYVAYQAVMDAMGLLFVVGVGMVLYRRYWVRSKRLWGPHTSISDDAFVWTLFALGVGGFLLEALGILARGFPDHEVASFVGFALARGLELGGLSGSGATTLYPAVWWLHSLHALAFVALLPYFKAFHMLSSFANVVAADEDAGRRLPAMPADVEHESAAEIDHFSWKELLDQDACTNCGRCSSVCPAKASDRPLDPREVILDLKAYRESLDAGGEKRPIVGDGGLARTDGGTATTSGETAADDGSRSPSPDGTGAADPGPRVPDPHAERVGDDGTGSVIDAATMESCMACMACMDACPAEIEHLSTFTRLQRQLVDDGAVDGNVQDVFQDVMQRGNTFGESQDARADWAEPLDIEPTDAREESVEYLWYVGDYPSFDERNREVARALARIFEAAGVEWGILFDDERYDGNDVRRLGEEFLFLELAGHHVETFAECEFETIVCTDPHAFNTMQNEYPEVDFGEFADDPMMPFEFEGQWNADGSIDVRHWTQVVAELVADGRLGLDGDELDYTVTYHDPCHLGRYNDEYEAPRRILDAIGCDRQEMPRNRSDSFCCGGGGGGLWMEYDEAPKPSEERLREAIEDTAAGGDVEKFVVACPMCTTMFEDGRKTGGFEDDLDVVDVAELLLEALDPDGDDGHEGDGNEGTEDSDDGHRDGSKDGREDDGSNDDHESGDGSSNDDRESGDDGSASSN